MKLKSFYLKSLVIFLTGVVCYSSYSQDNEEHTQTIKGNIVDFQTQQPIDGATVRVLETKLGAYTKKDGSFRIENVPIGRHTIKVSAVGFEPKVRNIVLTSGKELQLSFQLQETFIETDTVDVVAARNSFEPINESAVISSTVFTTDDVERFAGSRMDPARMAQNYAGVVGANDNRNDIIIRGGSPTELLWRLDGLDIPNPNHFATQGATGGPVSLLNSTLLDDSDFFTGAYPAQYGDKMSGVFDLKTRKGNDEKYEFLGQFGFNGLEFGTEGPLPGVDGSFIANYRYSFLDLMEKMGIDFGFSGIPKYQDGTFKIDLNASEKHKLSFTGLFGISDIHIEESALDSVYTGDYDTKNGTDLVSGIINWKYLFSKNAYGQLTTGIVYSKYRTDLDSITTDANHNVTDIDLWFRQNSTEGYYTAKYVLNYSPSSKDYLSAGVELRDHFYDFFERRYEEGRDPSTLHYLNKSGSALHSLNFINWNRRFTENITINAGIHSQYMQVSDKYTIEPRIGFEWNFLPAHSFSLGWGIYRQSLPLIIYYSEDENQDLDFMQSIHYVAGYSYQLSMDAILKVEGYYKDISKAPVEADENTSWSFLNSGTNFGVVEGEGIIAKSTGLGKAYGADLSFIKHFSNGYYITATASYIRQQYKGSDAIWRFGAFDNMYVINLLSGYEWVINPDFTLEFSGRYTRTGGAPYTPIDLEESREKNSTKYAKELAYTLRNSPYSRLDMRIDFRNNFESFSIISYISAENVLSTENIYLRYYSRSSNSVKEVYQLGFFFVGGFRIEF